MRLLGFKHYLSSFIDVAAPLSFSGVEQGTTKLPFAALDCRFNAVRCCSIRHHEEAIGEVLMDVPAHECIHLATPRCDGSDAPPVQCWQDKPVSHIDTKLVAAAPTTGMALQSCVNPLGRTSTGGARNENHHFLRHFGFQRLPWGLV
jgi:hypothetical protein